MCGPPAILAVGAALSAAGTIVGGITAMQQGKYQAKVAERNAQVERENRNLEIEAGRREALNHYRRVAQLKGQQRVTAGANSASTDFGTAADIVADTEMLSREDVGNIYRQTHENVRGRDRAVANYLGEASAARSRGKAAFTQSLFQAGSTILGGAQQFGQMKADYGGTSGGKTKSAAGGSWMWGG